MKQYQQNLVLLALAASLLCCSADAFQSIQHLIQKWSPAAAALVSRKKALASRDSSSSPSSSTSSSSLHLFRRRRRDRKQGSLRRLFDLSESTTSSSSSSSSSRPLNYASKDESEDSSSSTWSKKAVSNNNNEYKESPLGVRRRVRSVLEKARKRTGIPNDSTTSTKPADFISEAAAIGAFANDIPADFVYSSNIINGASRGGYPQNNTQPLLVLASSSSRRSSTTTTATNVAATSKKGANGIPESDSNHDEDDSSSPETDSSSSSTASSNAADHHHHNVNVESLLETDGLPLEPLPFSLPTLTAEQEAALKRGERVQEQAKMGREGSGYVVLDIPAPAYAVWECLLDFEKYPENIGTVRSMRMFTNTHLKQTYMSEQPVTDGMDKKTRHYGNPSISRAAFVLSKFRLNIAAIHQYQPHPDGHYMIFTLDRACANVILQDAKGIWYTQENVETGMTRVYLLCELRVSKVLPTFIVDYAAKRAMPRATEWLRPTVAEFCSKWQGTTTNNNKTNG